MKKTATAAQEEEKVLEDEAKPESDEQEKQKEEEQKKKSSEDYPWMPKQIKEFLSNGNNKRNVLAGLSIVVIGSIVMYSYMQSQYITFNVRRGR